MWRLCRYAAHWHLFVPPCGAKLILLLCSAFHGGNLGSLEHEESKVCVKIGETGHVRFLFALNPKRLPSKNPPLLTPKKEPSKKPFCGTPKKVPSKRYPPKNAAPSVVVSRRWQLATARHREHCDSRFFAAGCLAQEFGGGFGATALPSCTVKEVGTVKSARGNHQSTKPPIQTINDTWLLLGNSGRSCTQEFAHFLS